MSLVPWCMLSRNGAPERLSVDRLNGPIIRSVQVSCPRRSEAVRSHGGAWMRGALAASVASSAKWCG
eukprot:6214783-Pleurochrysis_carterae.AAC.3